MNIGILTLPLRTNYGGILQAYALQTVLEEMGHKVVILDKSPYKHLPIWKMPLSYSKRILKKYVQRKDIRIFYEHWNNKSYPIISQYTQKFIKTYIHRKEVNDLNQLKENDFDALIVGSDQVWRIRYFSTMHSDIKNAFLYFARNWINVKRIAYAPSFGTEEWEYSKEQTAICKSLLHKFNAISVREISGIELCKKYFNINAQHVLDPTLLLNVTHYSKLANKANKIYPSNMLLHYILDENEKTNELIKCIATEKGLNIVRANSKVENQYADINERIQPPVEMWLSGFYNTDYVVTDSFHACAFSIIFNKPFIVYGNKDRGYARFTSLLSLFGLTNRLVTNIDEALVVIKENINWEAVNKLREEMKEKSIDFLKNNLE